MTRQYIKRHAGFTHLDSFIEVSPYLIAQNTVECEGFCDEKAFDSLQELFNMKKWTKEQADGYVAKLQSFIQSR
jgi:hypothetical protein